MAGIHKHPLTLALLGVAATLLFFFAVNPAFFFTDDRVGQYFPYGLAIKDMLLHGSFPFLTTRTLYGGALWLDWQYAIYNPLSLLLNLAIMPQHLGVSGLIYALVLNLLLTAGAYRLGRSYGLDAPFAALFGLLMGTNIHIIYIDSSDWTPAIASLAWMMFAWAALKDLLRAEDRVALPVLATALFIYLMFTAGWPHTDVAFCLIAAAVLVQDMLRPGRRTILRAALAAGLGAALCAPALVPVLAAFHWTARVETMGPSGEMLTANLWDLLNIGNPAWWSRMKGWEPDPMPLFFAAWFIVPALFFIRWREVRWKNYAGLFIPLALFAALACGLPEKQYLKHPLRWLPEVQALFLLVLLHVMQQPRLADFTFRRMTYAAAGALLLPLAALINHPENRPVALLVMPVALTPLLLYPQTRRGLALCLGISSVAVAMIVAQTYPLDIIFGPWAKDTRTIATPPAPQSPVSYTLFSGWPRLYAQVPPQKVDLAREAEFPISGLPIYYNINSINGYSSLGQHEARRVFRCQDCGSPCTILPAAALMRREAETGQRYLDLLKIDRVVTDKQTWKAETSKALPSDWKRSVHDTTALFDRPKPSSLPGTMSWHAAGLSVSDGGALSNGEYAEVKNGPAPSLVAYARLYYPGFKATLDGQKLDVRPIDGLLVGVKVPANAAGRLELSFLPPFFGISCAVALIGLILWGCGAIVERRRNHNR